MDEPSAAAHLSLAQAPRMPNGAYETSLAMAGILFLSLVGFVFYYGVYGDRITAGLDTACARAAFEAGRKLEALGNYEAALQHYRQAMEGRFADPNEFLMCGRAVGDLLYRHRRYAEAIAAYRGLPEQAFAAAGAYTGYVNALIEDGELEAAEPLARVWLAKAQEEASREQTLWAHKAMMDIMEATDRPDEALLHGRAMIENDIGAASGARLRIARILVSAGRPQEALEHVESFLELTTNAKLIEEARDLRELIVSAPGAP